MFSPEAGVHERTASLRNGKRRQRTSSSDSLAVRARQPKRTKRLALGEETFETTETYQHANGSTGRPGSGYSNGLRRRSSGAGESSFDSASGLAVRGKTGRKDKRGIRTEDRLELTHTDRYSLTRDRSIPQVLQDIINTEPWHGRLCPELGYAVAFTQRRAIIWRYGHCRAPYHDSGTHVIKLADAVAGTSSRQDIFTSLPIGTIVHDAGAGDLALLAILPGGKVQYYESVRAASETDAIRQKAPLSEPLKGTIAGLYSGETIVQITEAEPDGFLLATDSGRLVHLGVRDSQGKPLIISQYLKPPNHDKQGLFGSIRSALRFGEPSQGIVSVNTLPGRDRTHRKVLVATAKGTAQSWNIARHGPKTLENEWDLRSSLSEACKTVSSDILEHDLPNMLDLTLMPTRHGTSQAEINASILVSFPRPSSTKYFVVGISLGDAGVEIKVVHQIRSHTGTDTTPGLVGRAFKSRLIVPEPGHMAFVLFDTRMILVSLNRPRDTPDSQLHFEAQDVAENYEECLFYNQKRSFHTISAAADVAEDRSDKASCDVFIYGFGLVRLSATPADPKEKRNERYQKLVKSRLEQVVFFGSMPHNFLDFRNERIWETVTTDDIEGVLFSIVDSILDSSSRFVPPVSISMDHQVSHRIQAMQELNKFIQRWQIPVSSRWQLLWSAEKLVAAKAVFESYNKLVNARHTGQRLLLEEICDMIPKDSLHVREPAQGETDKVRHTITNNTAEIGRIVAWAQNAIDELYHEGVDNIAEQAPLVSQAGDIIIKALDSALKYREEHAESFGLGKDMMVESIYQGSYAEMLEAPWTSALELLESIPSLIFMTTQTASRLDSYDGSDLGYDPESLLFKIAEDAPALVNANLRAWEEHCRWLEARTDEHSRKEAVTYREKYQEARGEWLCLLSDISLEKSSTDLAEKFHDMGSLAMLTDRIRINAMDHLHAGSPEGREIAQASLDEVEIAENGYFDAYGHHWADAFFDRQVAEGRTATMLTRFPHRQLYLTQFLRSRKEVDARTCKLSWINEVSGERQFDRAADDLVQAQSDEQKLWAKQVELSIAKLSKLAAVERNQLDKDAAAKDVKKIDQRIQITKTQQELYEYLKPVFMGGIDASGAQDLAMETFGTYVSGKPVLRDILAHSLTQLVHREVLDIETLIDTLSLISQPEDDGEEPGFVSDRFYHALWLLHASGLERADPYRAELLEKCIWRRCILQDDWIALNRTEGVSDDALLSRFHGTAVYKTLIRGYESKLFETHPPLHPRAINPAGETVADLRKSTRYGPSSTESYLAELAKDHQVEDAALEEILNQGRLSLKWEGFVQLAVDDLRNEQDKLGQLMAFKVAERQAFEQITEQERSAEQLAVIPSQESQTQQGEPIANLNGLNGSLHDLSEQQNGHAVSEIQTMPKKSKKKTAATKTKTSKKKDTSQEKENKDSEGDIVMFA